MPCFRDTQTFYISCIVFSIEYSEAVFSLFVDINDIFILTMTFVTAISANNSYVKHAHLISCLTSIFARIN